MKKLIIIGCLGLLSSCADKVEKANLSYKVFPNISETKYDFNLGIIPTVDGRNSKFVFNHDDFFKDQITTSISDILFDEIRATSSFKTVKKLDKEVGFLPNSLQIQSFRNSQGRDALLLIQINKFNTNIRKLSDSDSSSDVSLTVFNNITYKIILADTESVVFLKTIDKTKSKTLKLSSDIHKTINQMAIRGIRNSVSDFKTEFLRSTSDFISTNTKKVRPAPTPTVVVKAKPAVVAKTKPAVVAKTKPAVVAKTKPAVVVKAKPAVVAKTEPAVVAKTEPAVVAKAKPAVVAKAKPAVVAKTKPAVVAKAKPAVVAKAKPAVVAKAKPAVVAKAKPAVVAKAKPKAKIVKKTKPVQKTVSVTKK